MTTMHTPTSAISFDNERGSYSKIDNDCDFIMDLDIRTKLYTHYFYPDEFLIIKFNEDETIAEIIDLGHNKRSKRIFENNDIIQEIKFDDNMPTNYKMNALPADYPLRKD